MKKIFAIALAFFVTQASADITFTPGQVLKATDLNAALAEKASKADLSASTTGKGAESIGFKRSDSGAVARTAADKMADIIHAKDFGVKCDSGTNDTTAINTALAAANGKSLVFPAGVCIYAGGGTLGNGTVVVGAGRNATIFRASTATGTLFTVSGYGAGLRSVGFAAGVTQTGGSYVVLSGPESFIDDFTMAGDFNGILMTGNVARIRHGRFGDGAAGAIRIRAEGGDNSQLIDDVLMGAQLPQVVSAGIRVRNSSALIISNTSVIQQGHALLIDPYTATQSAATDAGGVFSLWVHHCFFDNSGGNAIRIVPTGTASVVRSRFDNVWASSSKLDGVFINNGGTGVLSGIHFTSPHLMLNGGSGLTTGGTVTDLSILGGIVANNSQGLYFNSGLSGVHVSGVTAGAGGGLPGNTNNGIVISAGVDNSVIVGNDLRGNGTALSNAGGSNQLIDNNLGASSTLVKVNGGSIDNTAIGATTQASGKFTTGWYTQNFGIGTTNTATGVYVATNATGAANAYAMRNVQAVQSDVTGTYISYSSVPNTAASSFTLSALQHFRADNATANAGSAITTQTGFLASGLSSAANNYGFQGALSAAANTYNLYMNGSAVNYLAGSLGIGTTSLTGVNLAVNKAITGGVNSYGVRSLGAVQSDVTTGAFAFDTSIDTQATAFTLGTLTHYRAQQGTIGAGSTVTNQYGFQAGSNLTGATNNYGFRGDLSAATGRWNFYASGTANNAFAGNTRFGGTTAPVATVDVTGSIAHSQQEIDLSYTYNTPTTGQTVTIASGTQTAIINPAGTLAALTVTLPACNSGYDGSLVRYASEQVITALTVNASSGSVSGAPTSLAVGAGNAYICRGSNTTWYRLY